MRVWVDSFRVVIEPPYARALCKLNPKRTSWMIGDIIVARPAVIAEIRGLLVEFVVEMT